MQGSQQLRISVLVNSISQSAGTFETETGARQHIGSVRVCSQVDAESAGRRLCGHYVPELLAGAGWIASAQHRQ